MAQDNRKLITDYFQIQSDFDALFHEVTSREFNARVRILSVPEIYKHTDGRPAVLKRGFLWVPNRICIREMPIHEMFYELAHEAGHTTKPYFDNESLDAEETKACLFQLLFSQKVKTRNFEWLDDFVSFEAYRRGHIERTCPKYDEYHNAAQHIARETNNNFAEGVRYVSSILDSLR